MAISSRAVGIVIACFWFNQCLAQHAQNSNIAPAPSSDPVVQPAADDPLVPAVRALLAKAKGLNDKIRRQRDADVQRRMLAEQSIVLRDWINNQSWGFSTKVIDIGENDGVFTLHADCPAALLAYSNNDGAFVRGGLYSYPIDVAVPEDVALAFKAGQEIQFAGTVRALFGNDVPIRKPTDPTVVLLDLCIPPVEKDSPLRIELSLINTTLSDANSRIVLPQHPETIAPPVQHLGKRPPLEAVLQELQSKIEKLAAEARRQKNTALITGLLSKHHEDIYSWLENQEWEFQTNVIDVVDNGGVFWLKSFPPKALQRFVYNAKAQSSGGIDARQPDVVISQEFAETIGKGDTVTYRGKVDLALGETRVTKGNFGAARGFSDVTDVFLFHLYLPPLDRQHPLNIAVSLSELQISKTAEAKRK